MNKLSELFADAENGDRIVLEAGGRYDVYPEDSFGLAGVFCTNTAARDENPDGRRDTPMLLRNRRDITVDGNGATVMIHGKMTPFVFLGCENVTVKNLTVDYHCPTMTEFTVLSNENGEVVIRFAPGCLFRIDGNRLFWRGETRDDGGCYWEDESNTHHRFAKIYDPFRDVFRECSPSVFTFERIETLSDDTLRVRPKEPEIYTPGFTFQTRNIIRDQTGALLDRCRDIRFENCRIRFMHGLGMVSQFCENVGFYGCDLTPGEGRTAASTADFFQFSGCRGRIEMIGCRAWGAHDDCVNVHGTHLRIEEIAPDGLSMLVRFCHRETWGIQAFAPGDEIEFIRWDTLRPYGSGRVRDFEKLNDTDILLHLDSPVPEGVEIRRDVVENAAWTPDLHIADCEFGATWGRGILCTTRGKVVIENNVFRHVGGSVLVVEDDCNFWFESGYTRHVVFRNNVVEGCMASQEYPDSPVIRYTPKVMDENSREFVHGSLRVSGNVFREPREGRHTFRLEYLREAVIEGNILDAPLNVSTHICGQIREENNIIGGNAYG